MLQIKSFFKRTSLYNILVFNTILWGCSFLILLFLFSGNSSPSKIDYIYTSSFIFSLIIPIWLNIYWLVPFFLKKEKYLIFCIIFIINLILFPQLNIYLFDLLISSIFKDYYFISYHNTLEVYLIFFIFFILTVLIKLAENWVYLNQLENKTLKIQNQQIENQLYYLKGQINPHFLFNSLNVLYSLAIDKNQNITNAILQLSDILRYIIYDINSEKISIYKEIELIKNYIKFEKNRQINDACIKFDCEVGNEVQIHPMLLLPLLENSFKHGLKSGVKNPYINIKLVIKNAKLTFIITNNFKEKNNNNISHNKGIGLKNIKENLKIIYPEKHLLSTEEKESIFNVVLTINL